LRVPESATIKRFREQGGLLDQRMARGYPADNCP
jgi:hypothetical protein